jgi:hypothetical protein
MNRKKEAMKEVVEELQDVAGLIQRHKDRIIIEDGYGGKREVVRAFVIGAGTNDPGLVLKVRQS